MAQAHQITTPQKSQIRKDLEDHVSLRAVAKKWGLNRNSIRHIRDASDDRTKKGTGRPQLLSTATMKTIEQYIDLNWQTATQPWETLIDVFGLTCSLSTFRRAMHRHGLGHYIAARTPLRTRVQRDNRHLWGARHQNDPDES